MARLSPSARPADRFDRLMAGVALTMAAAAIVVNFLTVIRGKAFWMDEWFIIANIKFRSAASLFGPLDYIQEFPRLYLVLVQAVVRAFDYAAFSYRLIPFLVQSANLVLIWIIGRKYLFIDRVRRSAFLVLLFAANMMTVFYFTKVKHYTMDIFVSLLAFLQFALLAEWVRRPRFDRKLVFILAVAALGPFFSYAYEYYAVPVLLVAAYSLLRSFKRGKAAWLCGLPILVFLAALALAFQVNLKYTLTNGAQQFAYGESFVHFHSLGLFLQDAARGILEFFSEFLFVPEFVQNTTAAFLLRLARYGFGLLTLLGLCLAAARLRRRVRRHPFGAPDPADFGPEFFFLASIFTAVALFLAQRIPLGLARLDYFAFLPMAYFAIEGLAAVLGHPRLLVRSAGRAALAGLIVFFSVFFIKANYNEVRGRGPGFDQSVFDNIGRAIRRAYETEAVLVVLGEVPLDPAVTLDYTDPRKTEILNREANDLILRAHPAFQVRRPLRIIAVESPADLAGVPLPTPTQRLILVKPHAYREGTRAEMLSVEAPAGRGRGGR